MRVRSVRTALLAGVLATAGVIVVDSAEAATTWIVTTGVDTGDGTCDATCTLRDAILAANSSAGADTIAFALTGGLTVAPTAALPDLTGDITIDGTTQDEDSPTPVVTLAQSGQFFTPGLRLTGSDNVVKGLVIINWSRAITVSGSGNTVAGNFIGTDSGGTTKHPNGDSGRPATTGAIEVTGSGNHIGGPLPEDRNVISGNDSTGVMISGDGAFGNDVTGNYIGTDLTGTQGLGNFGFGVSVDSGAPGAANTIVGNVFANNGVGAIDVTREGTVIRGNTIGLAGIVNFGHGIDVGASNVVIGGERAEQGNTIAHQAGGGVLLRPSPTGPVGVAIVNNRIHSNGRLGIDLKNSGAPAVNDLGDGDGGGNNGQNHPVITEADTRHVAGTLNSTPSTRFLLQIFRNDVCDPSGYGEGQDIVATTVVNTDESGNATFDLTDAPYAGVLTATATRTTVGNDGVPIETSGFSQCALVHVLPTAVADAYSIDEDTPLDVGAPGVLGNDVDPGGGGLTAQQAEVASHGTVVLQSDGSFSYSPVPNFFGTDSFSYQAKDSTGALSNPVTVTITVNNVDDPTFTSPDTYIATEGTPLTVAAPEGLLANDINLDPDTLTASVTTQPGSGSVTVNSDGSFTYTPNAGYNGPDSFTYSANDGTADSTPATVTLTVTPLDTAPTAVADSYSTPEDVALSVNAPGVLGNDTDPQGDTLSTTLVSGPAHGTLTLNPNGSLTYTPVANYNGPDSFTYKANDGALDSNTVTVTLTVTPVDDPPVQPPATGSGPGGGASSNPAGTAVTLPIPGGGPNETATATSLDTSVLPNSGLTIDGTGPNRTLTIAPNAFGPGGRVVVIITVTDGLTTAAARLAVIVGTNKGDVIKGTDRSEIIFGLGGNDVIQAKRGNDILVGGMGADILKGGFGDDLMFGNAGDDVLKGDIGRDHYVGGTGNDQYVGVLRNQGDTTG